MSPENVRTTSIEDAAESNPIHRRHAARVGRVIYKRIAGNLEFLCKFDDHFDRHTLIIARNMDVDDKRSVISQIL